MDAKERLRYFYEVVSRREQLEGLEEYVSRDCATRVGEQLIPTGVEGMRQHLLAVRNTYPDFRMRVICQFQDGESIVCEFIAEGTH